MASNEHFQRTLETVSHGTISYNLASFLEDQPAAHQDRLMAAWDFLASHATAAFTETYGAPFGVPVPISYQEPGYIQHSLNLYRDQIIRQRRSVRIPFRVVGNLNWPEGAPKREIKIMRDILDRFIGDNQHTVPFAYFESTETEPIVIGGIRKLTTEVLLPLIDQEALVGAHDADIVSISANHFPSVSYDYYRNWRTGSRQRPAGVTPIVTHAPVPQLPRINHLIRWFDDPELTQLTGIYYDLGAAFRADDYPPAGGYGRSIKLGETHDLLTRIARLERPTRPETIQSTAHLTTSPRRLVEKLSQLSKLDELWPPDDFKANHSYRVGDDTKFSRVKDLSESAHAHRLRLYGRSMLQSATAAQLHAADTSTAPWTIQQRLEAIRQRLGGPEDMFRAA